jgi:hypothetical protein
VFKTVDELKEFLVWAKAQRISEVKVGETHIVFSSLAIMDTLNSDSPASLTLAEAINAVQKTPEQLAKEEEDLLYASAT